MRRQAGDEHEEEPPDRDDALPPPPVELEPQVEEAEARLELRQPQARRRRPLVQDREEEQRHARRVHDERDDAEAVEPHVLVALADDARHPVEDAQRRRDGAVGEGLRRGDLAAVEERDRARDEHRVHQVQHREIRADRAVEGVGEPLRAAELGQRVERLEGAARARRPEREGVEHQQRHVEAEEEQRHRELEQQLAQVAAP